MSEHDMPPKSTPDSVPSDIPEGMPNDPNRPDNDAGVSPDYDTAGAALGALSAEEFDMLESAADLDPSVAAEFAAMQAIVAELSRLDPAQAMNRGRSAGIRSRLLSKAVSTPRAAADAKSASGPVNMLADVVGGSANATHKASTSPSTVAPKATAKPSATTAATTAVPPRMAPSRDVPEVDVGAGVNIAAREAREARQAPPVQRRSGIHPAWLALAAGVVIAVGGVQEWRIKQERDTMEQAVVARENGYLKRVTTLEAAVASRDSALQTLTGPSMKVVDLVNYSSQDPLARMFWDRKTAEWTMYAYNLRQPRPGKVFQVWLIASNSPAPISAGTFTPDARGAAIMHAKYALDRDALVKIAVSEEPAPGVPAPTGPIIIAGAGR